ncbi:hypothetical protein ACXU4B_03610 [Dyella soli]|uniref:DUF4345 domain-containing protein n=1 Tax=Dyella soli TaxID=522319 RepID=A0A4R0YQE3_9GAMM|nr:hypothetical protein [Dyella soli]TCI10125.1 hypothetical protein EZM97_14495 [Dyella soli]
MARADQAKRLAQWIVGYMAIGPLAVAADLAWHVFPDTPAIQLMRNSGAFAHEAWLVCGLLAVLTVVLLSFRPVYGYISLVILAAGYAPASFAVWQQSTMLHYWLSLAAIAFATYGVFVIQERQSSGDEGTS